MRPGSLPARSAWRCAARSASVDVHVPDEHFQARAFKRGADDLAIFHFFAINAGDPVGQRPGVTLPGHGPELVGHGQAFFVRSDDGGEEFARKFMPEMVQEILHRAADAPVVIGRAQERNIGVLDPLFKAGESLGATW